MRKLKLDLENVQVESFETSTRGEGIATVHGYQDFNLDPFRADGEAASDATCLNSCPTNWCGTCANSCWNTCNASCPGTSGVTEQPQQE